jgi:hypothetical protein
MWVFIAWLLGAIALLVGAVTAKRDRPGAYRARWPAQVMPGWSPTSGSSAISVTAAGSSGLEYAVAE